MWQASWTAGFATGLCVGMALLYLVDLYLDDVEPGEEVI